MLATDAQDINNCIGTKTNYEQIYLYEDEPRVAITPLQQKNLRMNVFIRRRA